MRTVRVANRTSGVELGDRIAVADGFFTRLRGLLGRPEPGPGAGLLITPSRGVHMYGMRYPLDVLILDADGRVVACYPDLAPGERTAMHRDGRHALELPAGTVAGTDTEVGHDLTWSAAGDQTTADAAGNHISSRGAGKHSAASSHGDEDDA